MKKFIPILALCAFLFPSYTLYANHVSYHLEGIDYCSNIEGDQTSVPAGYHAESDGTCTVLQAPVTIDLAQPGEAPVTTDITPVDQSGSATGPVQQIDVNPAGGGAVSATAQNVAVDGTVVSVSTTTPRLITSLEELETYIFDPKISKEEKISVIESRLKVVLQALVDLLTEELNLIIAAKEAEKNATSTPESL